MKNIVFVGMAGCGKSTLGKVVANTLNMTFVDTDKLIEQEFDLPLQTILDNNGQDGFLKIEEDVLSKVDLDNYVIATGGSAVYSEKAMTNLKKNGIVVYIYSPYDEVVKRLGNLATRGVVIKPGFTLEDVYNEREPLYRKYSDIVLDSTDNKSIATLNDMLLEELKKF